METRPHWNSSSNNNNNNNQNNNINNNNKLPNEIDNHFLFSNQQDIVPLESIESSSDPHQTFETKSRTINIPTSTRNYQADLKSTPRRHYSNRQQVASTVRQHQGSSSPSSSSSSSGPASQAGSRAAMLSYSHGQHKAAASQHQQMMMQHHQQQHQQHQHHQQQLKQRQMAAAAHRQHQAKLGNGAVGYGLPVSKSNQSAELTSSSTSSAEHTLDDLHALHQGGSSSSYATKHQQQLQQQQQQHQQQMMSHHGASSTGQRRLLAGDESSLGGGLSETTSGLMGSSNSGGAGSGGGGRFLLGILFTLAELLLFATLALWVYWAYQHDDGLAWSADRKQQFNAHAALMLLGFVFLNGQAMLIYRSFQCCSSKIYTKIMHTILFVLASSAIGLGLVLAWTAQDNVAIQQRPAAHLYSLHAWIGLTTVCLFVLQFAFGFVSFLILLCCDSATSKFRAALLPIHKTFGLTIFNLAVATCLTGLLQTARSRLSAKLNKTDYHELGEAGLLINLIGVALVALAILMPYIIRNLDLAPSSPTGSDSARLRQVAPRHFRSDLVDRHLKLAQLDMRI